MPPLPKLSTADLVEQLRELARASHLETFPELRLEEMVEWEAADFIEAAVTFLEGIKSGPLADQARALLNRL